MRRLNHLTAVCVGLLLLTTPAAFACEEFGAMMSSKCPMADSMAEMSDSVEMSPCHGAGQVAEDCCDVRSAPEPTQALSSESVKVLTTLEATDLHLVAPLSPAAPSLRTTSADAFCLHELGRYTLYSSFLL